MKSVRPGLVAVLKGVLGSSHVYPNLATFDEDSGRWVGWAEFPVVVYRQIDGKVTEHADVGRAGLRTDTFLLEVFAERGREDDVERLRMALEEKFPGPVSGDPDRPGEPVQWAAGGPWVRWAEASQPQSDFESGGGDPHLMLCFEQLTLDVTYTA